MEDGPATSLLLLPRLVRTDGDLALFRVIIGSSYIDRDHNNYIIYRAGVNKLEVLPTHPTRLFADRSVALLRCPDDGRFLVANLRSTFDLGQYALDLFDSRSGTWNTRSMRTEPPHKDCYYSTPTKVIALGGDRGSVGWVDLWNGILIGDLLPGGDGDDNNVLRFIRLPVLLAPNKMDPFCLTCDRDVSVGRDGSIKYSEVWTHPVPGSTYISEDWGAAILTWLEAQKKWHIDLKLKASDIIVDETHSQLLPQHDVKDTTKNATLSRLHTGHPTLSLHDDDVDGHEEQDSERSGCSHQETGGDSRSCQNKMKQKFEGGNTNEGKGVKDPQAPSYTIQAPSVPKEDSVGIFPPGQGSDVPEGIGAASANVSAPRSFTLEVKNDGAGDANEQTKETSASNATGLASLGPLSPSDEGAVLNNDLIEKTDGYLSDEHSFEHNQNADSNGDMSTTAYQLEDLTIHEENRPKPSDDNPGHLQNVNQGGLSNPQLTHSQGSTGIAPGPPLPHHLAALHPYAQGGLPLGYENMTGYPSLPQSYAYLPPAAYQQAYMNSGLFHQGAAAAPNSGIKYPMPQYNSNVPLGSLPQPASMLSNYVGGFGTANGMPQNFALNQSNPSATTTPGFDGAMPSQYKDGNPYMSLQQVEPTRERIHVE
uniref:Uncharacterized protein n=1 Tax=Aegilops tauschii TaxID=37682 RepID=M8C0B1_AEGTA